MKLRSCLKSQVTPRYASRIDSRRDACCHQAHIIFCIILVLVLRSGGVLHAQPCPPETFDYGPPCTEQAAQIVLCHSNSLEQLLPDPKECARAARDLELLGISDSFSCGFEQNVILIETLTPTDPDLVCMNLYYQVVSLEFVGFGEWWMVIFPHAINVGAMTEIYLTLPSVLSASVNASGWAGCPPEEISYSVLPNGTWHWILVSIFHVHGGCMQYDSHIYVTEGGQVMTPGDLNCDDAVNELDVPLFVDLVISPDQFSGCEPILGDLNFDDAVDGEDVQALLELMIR